MQTFKMFLCLYSFQIHRITDVCWDICVADVGSSLGRRTESCLSNCSERFVDTALFITNRFAQLASKMQGGRWSVDILKTISESQIEELKIASKECFRPSSLLSRRQAPLFQYFHMQITFVHAASQQNLWTIVVLNSVVHPNVVNLK